MAINNYDNIAIAALDRYGIQGQYQFLGHSDSITYCIETPADKYLLRIHQPISRQEDVWQRPEVIRSELLWLAALDRDTDIVVQQPVKNLQNKWVTEVSVESAKVFYCSLLHWIDGNILESHRTPQQAYQLGCLMAQLHQHSNGWQLPQNFIRPAYDQSRLTATLSALHPAVTQKLISAEDYQLLETAACQVQNMIEIGQTPDWGLIHADLHESNYLSYNEELRPIDFARCGFGYYLYDVAESLLHLLPTVRPSFLRGYQTVRKLPEDYLPITEGFTIMALIENFSFHWNNPKEHEWIAAEVKYVATEHIPPYLDGESFLFSK